MASDLNERSVCKIDAARLGDYDGRFGLHFRFSGPGWGVGYSVVFGPTGGELGREPAAIVASMVWLDDLLLAAKVHSLHELVGKPAASDWGACSCLGE